MATAGRQVRVFPPAEFLRFEVLDGPEQQASGGDGHCQLVRLRGGSLPFLRERSGIFNHNTFSSSNGIAEAATLRPPFNTVSRFRDPGMVNLNTTTNFRVFNAMLGMSSLDPIGVTNQNYWFNFQRALRFPTFNPSDPSTRFDAESPTQFPFPFKSASSAGLAPETNSGISLGMPAANAGLLRRGLTHTSPDRPLFDRSEILQILPGGESSHTDATRNPYFRHQFISKLDSMTTTRSSVFSVWLTVGYFEVERVPGFDPTNASHISAYPDGYQLGPGAG